MIIKNPKYSRKPNIQLNLDDLIIVYNDGMKWKGIPLNFMLEDKIIYDTVYDQVFFSRNQKETDKKKMSTNVSIIFLKDLYIPIIYEGKYKLENGQYKNILSGKKINLFDESPNIRKFESKIMTLKNLFVNYPDSVILQNEYNDNDIVHPKLSCVIEYISSTNPLDLTIKRILLIPKKTKKFNDMENNCINAYLMKNNKKIREKGGFIFFGMIEKLQDIANIKKYSC